MKKMNINSLKMKGMALLSVAVSLFMGSCWDTMEGVYPNESKPSIYEEITANADLSEFKALVDQADLYIYLFCPQQCGCTGIPG